MECCFIYMLLFYRTLAFVSADSNESTTTVEYYGIQKPEDTGPSPIFIIIPSIILGVPLLVLGCICCKAIICRSCNSPEINIAILKEQKKKQKYQRPDTSNSTKPFTKRSGIAGRSSRSTIHANGVGPGTGEMPRQSRMIVEDLDPPGKDPGTLEARLADRKRKHRIRRKSMQVEPQVMTVPIDEAVEDVENGQDRNDIKEQTVPGLHPYWCSENATSDVDNNVSIRRDSEKDVDSQEGSSVSTGQTEIHVEDTPVHKPRRKHRQRKHLEV